MMDQPPDLLMFVGRSHYDEESFLSEVENIGASKRIRDIPSDCVPGTSEVWFAMHGNVPEHLMKQYPSSTGVIFCRSILSHYDLIVEDDIADDDPIWALVGRHTHVIKMSQVIREEVARGCGFRRPGKYLMATESYDFEPMPIAVPHMRGYRYVSKDRLFEQLQIFQNAPQEFVPPNITMLCDEDQLSNEELIMLHHVRQMMNR